MSEPIILVGNFEAILNAICHAEYFAPSNIKIEFFPDKVKVTNPGISITTER